MASQPSGSLDTASSHFEAGAATSTLNVPICRSCDRVHWYPRRACPFCGSRDIELRPSSGQGSLYAFSVMRRAAPPYVLAYVTLSEGPLMLTNIVDTPVEDLRIGEALELVLQGRGDQQNLPMFRPLQNRETGVDR